jgi:hypothetical protein
MGPAGRARLWDQPVHGPWHPGRQKGPGGSGQGCTLMSYVHSNALGP